MVKYIFTPWRNRQELLKVRQQFYPEASSPLESAAHYANDPNLEQNRERRREQSGAISRVSMWMGRGNCPHLVESTALLMAAILLDEGIDGASKTESSEYAVRSAYSAAFSRFVTGLLDGQQDKQRKMSMFSIAKTIGLPATFVELRHQATHEHLPSLVRLRPAARKALVWIWEYYWQHLTDNTPSPKEPQDPCRDSVLEFLGEDAASEEGLPALVTRWGEVRLLNALMGITETAQSTSLLLKALRLSRQVMLAGGQTKVVDSQTVPDLEQIKTDVAQARQELEAEVAVPASSQSRPESEEEDLGENFWPMYEEPWRSRPIGCA